MKNLLAMLLAAGAALAVASVAAAEIKIMEKETAAGPYQPSWDSLSKYQCPEWFRDAKFGIWAHWSAQCVPEEGDWYARRMYESTSVDKKTGKRLGPSADYQYHVAHYGHPSTFGFKDICNLWKADKWEPEKLIDLYKRAGAKYFVALANHHCNFDCYDSKYQPWNTMNVGPKKDIVGIWAKAARNAGLRFGVTVHAARSWSWYEPAHGADPSGPLKGVSYDGNLTQADGKGLWWDGLDPQELYCRTHSARTTPDAAYCEKFFLRTNDLVDKYRPDLLYFDDGVMPLNGVSDAGLRIAAHYYNSSILWHGKNEAVMNTKGLDARQRKCLVWDIERGRSDRIEPYPWQTDTCIGSWHYSRSIHERHRYKTAATVITMLVDIVSKNGNLLLNVPVRGDGTIDEDEVKVLEDIAAWMAINGESIFETRPWKVFGEGPPEELGAGNFNESKARPFTAEDVRFTVKGKVLYATLFGWPGGEAIIHALGTSEKMEIAEIRMLGVDKPLTFSRDAKGLTVKMPKQKPCDHAFVLKITAR